jgi:outer membrane protein
MNLFFLMIVLSVDTLKVTEDQAVQIALKNNPQIVAARLSVDASKYDVLASRSSFFPSIDASASFARLSYVQKMTMPVLQYLEPGPGGILIPHFTYTEMEFGKPNNYRMQLSVSYPIFTWGARLNAYRASQLSSRAKELELKITEAQVENQVRKLYYAALMAKSFYQLSISALNEKKSHYEAAKERYDNGYASDFELLRAEVEWKNAEPTLIQAENGYKSAVEALRFAMGIEINKIKKQ